jgi:hypothetical protein
MRRANFIAAAAGAVCFFDIARRAGAALPPRIAIIVAADTGVSTPDTTRFEARLGHGILEHPAYQLVTRDRLAAAIREQGLSNSAYADPATAAQLGKVIGASQILHVTLAIDVSQTSGLMEHEKYDATSDFTVIEVATARVVATGSGEGQTERSAAGGGDFTDSAARVRRSAIDACADDVVGQLNLH